jgi:hypothetical protein
VFYCRSVVIIADVMLGFISGIMSANTKAQLIYGNSTSNIMGMFAISYGNSSGIPSHPGYASTLLLKHL